MHFSGIGNDSSLGEWSLTLGSTWWRFLKLPDMDQKSFIASPASGSESWGCGKDPSDSPRKSMWLSLLELVDAVSRWMFSGPDLLQGFWFVHWKSKFSLFGKYHLFRIEFFRVDFRCVHRFQQLKVCDQYVTLPNFPPRRERIRGSIQEKLSFQIDGCVTGPSQL